LKENKELEDAWRTLSHHAIESHVIWKLSMSENDGNDAHHHSGH
jgi:hypothetical protein